MFDEVLQLFQETIGCVVLKRQPVLSYRLSSATAKSDSINLKTESDWEGCLEDVEREQVKETGASVPVNLVVGDSVCYARLRTTLHPSYFIGLPGISIWPLSETS